MQQAGENVAGWELEFEDTFAGPGLDAGHWLPHHLPHEWLPDRIGFLMDGELRKLVRQSPDYPMQLMLGLYEFGGPHAGDRYPKELLVEHVRGYRTA